MKKQLIISSGLLLLLLSLGMYIGSISGAIDNSINDGRISTSSTDPAPATDQTAITTLYWTPNGKGNRIALLDTSSSPNAWTLINSPAVSIAVPSTTNQMYDLFGYLSSGALALSATAWTNDTTRAVALTTQDGVYVKTGAVNYRYLGSFRTTSVSGQTEIVFSSASRAPNIGIWNYYNRVPARCLRLENTSSWTCTSTSWQLLNQSASNEITFVVGVVDDIIESNEGAVAINGSSIWCLGIGLNSITATSGLNSGGWNSSQPNSANSSLAIPPALGLNYVSALQSVGGSTATFYGNAAEGQMAPAMGLNLRIRY